MEPSEPVVVASYICSPIKMTDGIFYVYTHRRFVDNSIFYIGKGSKDRAYTKKNRNKHWHNIVNKDGGYYVEFLVIGVEEEFAYFIEEEAIIKYRKFYNLANYTNGGLGITGYKHTHNTKTKLKASAYDKRGENNGFWGKQHSADSKQKMAEAKRNESEEIRLKRSISAKNRKKRPHSIETKKKISKLKWWNNGVITKRSETKPDGEWTQGRLIK